MFSFERLTVEDLAFVLEVRNECRGMLHDDRQFTLQQCQEWFHTSRPDFRIVKYRGERIGYFRLSNHDPVERSIYVGADLHPKFRGRGLAYPAYEAFSGILKSEYDVLMARLEVLSHNIIALRLYEKLGFVEVDRRRCVGVRDGILVDSIVMSWPFPSR